MKPFYRRRAVIDGDGEGELMHNKADRIEDEFLSREEGNVSSVLARRCLFGGV